MIGTNREKTVTYCLRCLLIKDALGHRRVNVCSSDG